MPTIFRHGGLRYFFYSNEGSPRERIHIHVMGAGRDAKIWLEPDISVADSFGFNPRELSDILRVVSGRTDEIRKAWHEHFGDNGSF